MTEITDRDSDYYWTSKGQTQSKPLGFHAVNPHYLEKNRQK